MGKHTLRDRPPVTPQAPSHPRVTGNVLPKRIPGTHWPPTGPEGSKWNTPPGGYLIHKKGARR